MKLSALIFRNRIKPFVITQLILIIPMLIIGIYVLKDEDVNFFYFGILQIVNAGFWFLMGLENFILKKKDFSLVSFFITVLFILLAIQIFHVIKIKQ
jgi:hypothetical protein